MENYVNGTMSILGRKSLRGIRGTSYEHCFGFVSHEVMHVMQSARINHPRCFETTPYEHNFIQPVSRLVCLYRWCPTNDWRHILMFTSVTSYDVDWTSCFPYDII
jgi:hypothetical protein